MALHHAQTVLGENKIAFCIYHPWRMTRAPLRHRLCHFSAARRSPYDPATLSLTPVCLLVTAIILYMFRTQKASETCRVLLQLLINILPSCITLVLYIYSRLTLHIVCVSVFFICKGTRYLYWGWCANWQL